MDGSIEIRKVPPKEMYELVQILEIGKSWKKLMCMVPKGWNSESLKYTYEHVKRIEDASGYQKRPCAEIFLEEWGSSGKEQPTLNFLLHLLQKAELYRAAEYVAVQLLGAPVPSRPSTGPAASVDVSEKNIQILIDTRLEDIKLQKLTKQCQVGNQYKVLADNTQEKLSSEEDTQENAWIYLQTVDRNIEENHISKVDTGKARKLINNDVFHDMNSNENDSSDITSRGLLNITIEHVPYDELEQCTNSFCDTPFSSNDQSSGNKLGSGAFGSVYYGVLSCTKVAVKRLKSDAVSIEKQFQNEVETLSKYQHENLLPLLRYSCDGPYYCLVYAYMSNGSLQDKLACKDSCRILLYKERLNMALGTARGILYLHTAFEKPLIHRDIKSANILLDDHLIPKLGDFGLVHLGPTGQPGQSIAQTSTVFGTSAYMAREAFWGDISVKLDTFSFGVVLLELLTSLAPYDENREGRDLITHVEDNCEKSIKPLLDSKAGSWVIGDQDISDSIYLLALECLKERRQSRPDISKIVERLEELIIDE